MRTGASPAFFEKNKIDFDQANISITVTDGTATDTGEDFIDQIRNRRNHSGWMTTGSADAANTQVDIDTTDAVTINVLFMIQHNFKDFTFKYHNGSSYETLVTGSGNTQEDSYYKFKAVTGNLFRLIITGTMTADDDKRLAQMILTQFVGQFSEKPEFYPVDGKNRRRIQFLSGKEKIVRTTGAFECRVQRDNMRAEADLNLVETIYNSVEGLLIWLCGDDTQQFTSVRYTWRRRDIYLVVARNEYEPHFDDSFYDRGVNVDIRLVESV